MIILFFENQKYHQNDTGEIIHLLTLNKSQVTNKKIQLIFDNPRIKIKFILIIKHIKSRRPSKVQQCRIFKDFEESLEHLRIFP